MMHYIQKLVKVTRTTLPEEGWRADQLKEK